MPVLTRVLTPEDYGIISMQAVILGIVSPFIGLSVHGSISVRFYDMKKEELARYIGNSFFILFMSTVVVSCLLFIGSRFVSHWTSFPAQWLFSVVVIAFGQFIILIRMILWQCQGRPFHFATFQILQMVINVGLSVYLIVVERMDWKGRIIAYIVTITLFSIFGFILLIRSGWIKFNFDRKDIRRGLKFGCPLIPHALGGMLITQTDRLFITNMVGIHDTGIYAVGFQIGMIIEILASSFNRAYVPWLFERLKKEEPAIKLKIVKLTYKYFLVIFGLAIALAFLAPIFIPFFIGKAFGGAVKYIVWIAIGGSFSGMYYMVANYIFYAGATHLLALVTFFTATINVILNYWFIKQNGAVGAAQASTVSFLISFLLTWYLSSRVFDMPWNLKVKD